MIWNSINEASIENLATYVDSGGGEDITLDFKESLPSNYSKDRINFLADVTAFANTSGGYLVYGVEETKVSGKRTGTYALTGITPSNIDEEKLRLEHLIHNGTSPRCVVRMRHLSIDAGKHVLIVHAPYSLFGPHQVILEGHNQFYGRNSSGNYRLDINQLRSSFNRSADLLQQVDDFRNQRFMRVAANDGFSILDNEPKVLLHMIPLAHFGSFDAQIDFKIFTRNNQKLIPLTNFNSNFIGTHNLEGYLISYHIGGNKDFNSPGYTELFRNGVIETADSNILTRFNPSTPNLIAGQSLVNAIRSGISRYIQTYKELGIEPPFAICLSLSDVRGRSFAPRDHAEVVFNMPIRAIDRDNLLLPPQLLNSFDEVDQAMNRMLDMLWNAGGSPKCPYGEISKDL